MSARGTKEAEAVAELEKPAAVMRRLAHSKIDQSPSPTPKKSPPGPSPAEVQEKQDKETMARFHASHLFGEDDR